MKVVAGGVLVGLLTALVLTRLISNLFFGIGAADPFTFITVSILLVSIALLACLLPARRAMAVQPATVLRAE